MTSLLILGGLLVTWIATAIVQVFRVNRIVKQLVPIYEEYAGAYACFQGDRQLLEEAIKDLRLGKAQSHPYLSEDAIDQYFEDARSLDWLKPTLQHWMRLRDRVNSARLINKDSLIDSLEQELIAKGEARFRIRDYSDWGKFEQPDERQSLRLELRMLLKEDHIPRFKIF
jgi:hypothetical protein